ncbi:hypothetical protein OBG91_15800 [Lactococcus lactis]|nr:hypothetical protein [Lactococcus lactis]
MPTATPCSMSIQRRAEDIATAGDIIVMPRAGGADVTWPLVRLIRAGGGAIAAAPKIATFEPRRAADALFQASMSRDAPG